MEEGVHPHSTILGPPSDFFMDLDYMDELLLEGCWLETKGSEFSYFDTSTPISPIELPFTWPNLDANHGESGGSPLKESQEERQKSSFSENLSISESERPLHHIKSQSHVQILCNDLNSYVQSENHMLDVPEHSKRWWIGPRSSTSVMDRLIRALGYIKDCSRDKNVLIQVWVPVNRGGKCVLTTNDQPFSLDLNCPRLAHYREISVDYQFPAEDDSKEVVGLPGRVFRSKAPEWTPDVRFFTRDEYPRVGHARRYDVRGTIAVPILEEGSRSCLGVIEVVMTTQKIKYRPELESVCKALEAVDFRSLVLSNTQNTKTLDVPYQAALPEILEVLKSACTTHGLPLAQTWIPCLLQGKGGCLHSEENLRNCVSPVESACYIGDPGIQGFHEACSEYHLLKDQGIVGRAFRTNQPCFSHDVTSFSKIEYPLSHHARIFGLQAAVAIRLRSTCTGSADFVLEFFLPVKCKDPDKQRDLLTSLSNVIRNVCRTLRVVTDKELREESEFLDQVENHPKIKFSKEVAEIDEMQILWDYSKHVEHHKGGSDVSLSQDGKSKEKLSEESYKVGMYQRDSNSREGTTDAANPSTSGDYSRLYTKKTGDKRHIKAEKTITLQILRQHFAGSLKDAAKNLGVCPTTLKRICRHHGIQRWPSRKIKKVGHSLQKIQRVIDSVQAASGVLQIDSFYSNFPELASPNGSKTTQLLNCNLTDHLKPIDRPESDKSPPRPAALVSPSSSFSQSSSSSQSYSSGVRPNSYAGAAGCEYPTPKEEYVKGILKRARSDANLHLSSNGPKFLQRSQSHVSFCGPAKPESLPPVAEHSGRKFQEMDAPRIKVTFGEDTIRFRMQNTWKYKDLFEEISGRFGIHDARGFSLKYLDDDAEWVLLTCDADLEECIDVSRSSRSHTIKLSFSGGDSQSQCCVRSFDVIGGSL